MALARTLDSVFILSIVFVSKAIFNDGFIKFVDTLPHIGSIKCEALNSSLPPVHTNVISMDNSDSAL